MREWNEIQQRLQRVERFASWMDDRVAVPGTRIRFGLDAVIGLLPGVGDLTTAVASLWLLSEAMKLGTPKRLVFRMMINVLVDLALGSIPLLGDLFDVYWKSNRRNADLLRRHLEQSRTPESA